MFESHRPLTLRDVLASVNWPTIILVLTLSAIGAGTLYSVAGGAIEPWALRHAVRCLAGLGLLIVLARVPVRIWLDLAVPVYLVALVLLVGVALAGVEAMGARRWLSIGGVSIQPSEIMKIGLVLCLARYYQALPAASVSKPQWVGGALLLIALPAGLVVRQPDLGTAVMLAAIGLGVMFLAGVSLWYFALGVAASVAAVPHVLGTLHDYQRRRIDVFLDPSTDPLGAGYHITQARIALGAGGMNGQGYLQGTQTQLDFVPEKMTDFVFVLIGEEWGFAGSLTVLALYGLLTALLMGMALAARTRFARLMLGGAALSLSLYVVINIGMVTGAVPVVGVPLPFISYGGTAMLTLMALLGLAMSAHIHPLDERS